MQTITDNNGTDHVIIQYADSKFEYDITPFGHGYTVQMSSGDEEYFDSVADANYGIKRDIVHILWDNHPTPKGKLWTNDDSDSKNKINESYLVFTFAINIVNFEFKYDSDFNQK